MQQHILYSIIVVCLNSGQRLCDTIESILNQTYEDYEVIVKDGGSSDGSVERLMEVCDDKRIHVHTRQDTGIYDAMNQAVELARGEYYLFLNTGDSFYDETVLNKITSEIKWCPNARTQASVCGYSVPKIWTRSGSKSLIMASRLSSSPAS